MANGMPMVATPPPNPLTPVVGSPVFQHPFQTPSPAAFQQQPYTTPSPFRSISAASDGLSSKIYVQRYTNLCLRFTAFVFAFVSAIIIATSSQAKGRIQYNFLKFSEFRYCISAAIVASLYTAMQLLKCINEIAFKGFFVSGNVSDYITFIFDQIVTYLLLSSSSVFVLAIEGVPKGTSSRNAVGQLTSLLEDTDIVVKALSIGDFEFKAPRGHAFLYLLCFRCFRSMSWRIKLALHFTLVFVRKLTFNRDVTITWWRSVIKRRGRQWVFESV